jgi:hypothetical protein
MCSWRGLSQEKQVNLIVRQLLFLANKTDKLEQMYALVRALLGVGSANTAVKHR